MSQKIYKNDNQTIIANRMDDVTNVSFKEYMLKSYAMSIAPVISTLAFKFLPIDSYIVSRQSLELAKTELEKLGEITLPEQIKQLLESDLKKKEQEKIWKGVSLSTNQLGAFFVYADNLGFKFSSYRFEGTPKSYNIQDLPTFAYIDDNDELHKVGGHSLSDGQLKALIHESKVIYVQMVSKGSHWHAFIRTYQGLKGIESGTQGSFPHIHYYSDKNGTSREDFVNMIKNGNYPTAKVHIPLVES